MGKVNGNINAIKVVAIFMVIALHYLNEGIGGALAIIDQKTINYYIAWFIESLCIIANNLFVLASAYFLSDNIKGPKISKVVKLLFICWGYSILFWVGGVILGLNEISAASFVDGMNPFLKDRYWFVITYIIMYLIYPYLNNVINNLNERKHRNLLIILLIFFSIWPSFLPYAPNNDGGYGIISFVLLYFIGAYLRRYSLNKFSKYQYLTVYIGCVSIVFFLSAFKGHLSSLDYNFIFNIIGTVAVFSFFMKLNIDNELINKISKHTFSIYIIHLNNFIVSVVIYKVLNISGFYNSKLMILHFIISVIIWFAISILIDILACKSINKLTVVNKYFNKYIIRIDDFSNYIY